MLTELESAQQEIEMLRRENESLKATANGYAEAAEALRTITEGTASATGKEFLRALVRHLASVLKVRYAFIGELYGAKSDRVRTLAVWAGDAPGNDFEYALVGVPSTHVIGKTLCYYPDTMRQRFPEDGIVAEMNVESYLGVPLFDTAGKPLGLLAIMHDAPLQESLDRSRIMTLFAVRAGAELERLRASDLLRDSEQRYRNAIKAARGVVYELDFASNTYSYMDEGIECLLGYHPGEINSELWKTIGSQVERYGPLAQMDKVEAQKRYRSGEIAVWLADYKCRTREGGIRWLADASVLLRDSENNVYGSLGILQDITERKVTELELREAVRRFKNGSLTNSVVLF